MSQSEKTYAELAKMSIQAGVEGTGKPMMVKPVDPNSKPQIKARMQPISKPKPARFTGDSIF